MNSSDVVNDDPEILPQSHGTLFPSISLVLQATSLGKTAQCYTVSKKKERRESFSIAYLVLDCMQ